MRGVERKMYNGRNNLVIRLFLMAFLVLNLQMLDNKVVATRPETMEEEEGTWVPMREMKPTKVDSQLRAMKRFKADSQDDKDYNSAYWRRRKYHTMHRYGPWEYYNEDEHIRYCSCVEYRQLEKHNYKYEGAGRMACKECIATKEVGEHNYDIVDDMKLTDMLKSDSYKNGEILSYSQVYNPNPAPYTWCVRNEFCCKKCGAEYYINRVHTWVNGRCSRKYCGIER